MVSRAFIMEGGGDKIAPAEAVFGKVIFNILRIFGIAQIALD